jgi:hypothetical protein
VSDNGVRHDHASRVAAEIINLVNRGDPKAVSFGRVLYTILHMIYEVERELHDTWARPSVNGSDLAKPLPSPPTHRRGEDFLVRGSDARTFQESP